MRNWLVVLVLLFVELPQSAIQAVAMRWYARRRGGPGSVQGS